jgi:hypothetical protein
MSTFDAFTCDTPGIITRLMLADLGEIREEQNQQERESWMN